MPLNRLSGLAVLVFALAMIFAVIPHHTETVDSGWMRPQTLPMICAVGLAVLGAVHTVAAGGATAVAPRQMARAGLATALTAAAIWAMGRWGFLPVAPVLVAALMAMTGERRPPWLLAGVVAVPLAVWGVVTALLGRPLP